MADSPPILSQEQVQSSTQIFSLSAGLYTVVVTENRFRNAQDKIPLPALHVAETPYSKNGAVEFLASSGSTWLSRVGEALAIKVSGEQAVVAFTSLKPESHPDATIGINLQRVGTSGAAPALLARPTHTGQPDGSAGQRVLRCEVVVHVQRYGDIRVSDVGWAGLQGRGHWIEGVSITPLEDISRHDLEYKGLTSNGIETPWVKAGEFCGSRGRELALTGLAIQLTGEAARHYDVSYEGSFVGGGRMAKGQNGSPLRSDRIGDPLEALRVVVVEKRKDPKSERIF
ncbi:hypothetical protein [Jiella sp. M17.18]|uniref:hypothetical protein n=1 Tax=Jiella sp. M17.18 TaxID=3234247 RepID=UPI0034DFA1AF